jgi:hypothetical protein
LKKKNIWLKGKWQKNIEIKTKITEFEIIKIINLIWRIKLKVIKTLTKKQRKKNKKLKVQELNWKTLYTQIKN